IAPPWNLTYRRIFPGPSGLVAQSSARTRLRAPCNSRVTCTRLRTHAGPTLRLHTRSHFPGDSVGGATNALTTQPSKSKATHIRGATRLFSSTRMWRLLNGPGFSKNPIRGLDAGGVIISRTPKCGQIIRRIDFILKSRLGLNQRGLDSP